MALVGVGDILSDPDFADTITVVQRQQTVGADGKAVESEIGRIDVVAVVEPAGKSRNVLVKSDGTQITYDISVWTTLPLSAGNIAGRLPDIIEFNGNEFIVSSTSDYQNFVPGYTQGYCVTRDVAPAS